MSKKKIEEDYWKEELKALEGFQGTGDVLEFFQLKHLVEPGQVFSPQDKQLNSLANAYWGALMLVKEYRKQIEELKRQLEGRMF